VEFEAEVSDILHLTINGKTYSNLIPIIRHLGILYSYYPKDPITAYEADWVISTIDDCQLEADLDEN